MALLNEVANVGILVLQRVCEKLQCPPKTLEFGGETKCFSYRKEKRESEKETKQRGTAVKINQSDSDINMEVIEPVFQLKLRWR